VTFDKLFVIFTDPFFWHVDDEALPDNLARLFATLVDESRPGAGWIGVPDPDDDGGLQWLQGDAARERIAHAHTVWAAAHEHRVAPDDAYRAFVERPLTAFVDRERLKALVEALDDEPPAALDHEQVVGVSLFNDWSLLDDSILWTPQLRLLGYWPESRRLAPPPPTEPRRVTMSPEHATTLLEDVLWKEVGGAFSRVRLAAGFGRAILLGGDYFPPVFYVAVPTEESLPARPEGLLEEPCIGALSVFTSRIMFTDDPLSDDVSGGFLEGTLMTLRREYSRRGVAVDYLLVGWWRAERETFGAREETEAVFVADQLAYPDSYVIAPLERLRHAQTRAKLRLGLWNGSLDEAAQLAGDLQGALGTARPSDALYAEAFRAVVGHLRLSLARLTPRVLRLADDVRDRQREWRRVQASAARQARQRLSFRSVAGLRPLAELVQSHRERIIFQEFSDDLDGEVERVTRVTSYTEAVQQHLRDIHDFQQRDEDVRQARRSRRLATVFGSLAILTAFPFLVGELDWFRWMEEVEDGGVADPIASVYHILDGFHGELVFLTMLASLALVVLVVLSALGLGWFDRADDRVLARIRPVRRKLEEAWANNRLAATQTRELSRERIEALDEEACGHLAEVFEWLAESGASSAARLGGREPTQRIRRQLAELEERTARFAVAMDLFDDRPDVLALPRLACLLHLKSTDILQYSPIARPELDAVFRVYGFDEQAIEAARSAGEEHRHLPIGELATKLKALGVTVDREASA